MGQMHDIAANGLVMVGCGIMGQALMKGWLSAGLRADAVTVLDPTPSDWLIARPGLHVNGDLPDAPAAIVIATKPQILDQVLPNLRRFGRAPPPSSPSRRARPSYCLKRISVHKLL